MKIYLTNLKALEAEKEVFKRRVIEVEAEKEKEKEVFKRRVKEIEIVIDKVKKIMDLGITDTKIPIIPENVPIINKILKIIYKNESYLNWEKQELIVYESNYFTIYKIEDDLNLDIHQNSIFIGINIKNAFSKAVDY